MKKLLFVFGLIVVGFCAFFTFENYQFNQLINQSSINGMNIPINPNAPVNSKAAIVINASVDSVWKTLTNIKNWPQWQKNITEVEVLSEIEEGTAFQWKAGGLTFHSKIHTKKPMQAFGWTGTTLGASAIHNWHFIAENGRTIVRVEESLQGVFPRLFQGYFQKNLDLGVVQNLKELKDASELR
ncbi:Polyketide cyclase/dehydrase [Emticicia oligotrophica DSM 17448]|uniref:Polyketide cyclase/dehydrase n=1 Tax=Emticicia oligotrophica (strain DSM 17448 / CIP 109782 / MTCC 6937 / GPTSA100-15) TaxID=929562 RepID=A0ABM5MY47_EMTOG|nr:SRPBCC family protein [Emticicia oligotrophica]AFK02023.1 Polyketide cyclase/dehydrase [Emticicia oligotrophica DSM 17448]